MPTQTRRQALLAAGVATLAPAAAGAAPFTPSGRVKHSAVWWCFHSTGPKWDAQTMCRTAVDLGLKSVELVDPEHWPTLKKHGLACAIAGNGYPKAGFVYGLN